MGFRWVCSVLVLLASEALPCILACAISRRKVWVYLGTGNTPVTWGDGWLPFSAASSYSFLPYLRLIIDGSTKITNKSRQTILEASLFAQIITVFSLPDPSSAVRSIFSWTTCVKRETAVLFDVYVVFLLVFITLIHFIRYYNYWQQAFIIQLGLLNAQAIVFFSSMLIAFPLCRYYSWINLKFTDIMALIWILIDIFSCSTIEVDVLLLGLTVMAKFATYTLSTNRIWWVNPIMVGPFGSSENQTFPIVT